MKKIAMKVLVKTLKVKHEVYMLSEDDTEVILMIDASNAFNSINREACLHNTKVLCPTLVKFINNCYSFKIIREKNTGRLSSNGYLWFTPLLAWLSNFSKEQVTTKVTAPT